MTKKVAFDNKKECTTVKEITENKISNKKYNYNHLHYHVGDFEQLRSEINKIQPLNKSYQLNQKNNFIKKYSNTQICKNTIDAKKCYQKFKTHSNYKKHLYIALKTFMIYFKKGIFVSIRNKQVTIIPMMYYNYKNKFFLKNLKTKKYILNANEWHIDGCYIRMSVKTKVKPAEWDVSQYYYFMQELCKNRNISDIDFIINNSDFPVLHNKLPFLNKGFIPVFSQSSHPKFFDLNIPSVDTIEHFYKKSFINCNSSSSCRDVFTISKNISWEKKLNKIFFRGQTSGCQTGLKNHRIQALMLSKNKNKPIHKHMDVEVHPNGTQVYRLTENKSYQKISITDFPFKEDYVPFEDWSKYKYILNIEGWVAANRFLKSLSIGSLIINVKSEYNLWFEQFAEKKDLFAEITSYSQLEKVFKHYQKNPEKAKQMAINGKQFVKKILTKKVMYDYMEFILHECNKSP